jgi:N-acetylglucosaminyldiphosphoundecaprenol N-acetyl-beta-D-mannosaminyltransferase
VSGWESPPFRALTDQEGVSLRGRILDAGTDILWVGLGSPKQEVFMQTHAPRLPGVVAMGVGAAFDVNVGMIARAPRWICFVGLEWLYRLLREPRRLWPRYAEVVPVFLRLAIGHLAQSKFVPNKAVKSGRSGAIG